MICEKIRLDPRVLFFIVTVVKNTLQCLMRTQQEARNSTRKKKNQKRDTSEGKIRPLF